MASQTASSLCQTVLQQLDKSLAEVAQSESKEEFEEFPPSLAIYPILLLASLLLPKST